MEHERPLILITNDDSISAPGVHRLVDCVRELGEVYMVAPREQHSGQSSALTVGAPLNIRECDCNTEGVRIFTVNGTPVDCIKLALHAIVPRKPDLVLAGINHGSNSAINVTYSGTMGAVIEGCIQHIPSVGFSLLHHSMKADFSLSADFVTDISRKVLEQGLPPHVCLNVNIPAKVRPEGVHVCRAARGRWSEEYKRYIDPNGNPFYWLTGRFVNEEPEADDTDEFWLARRHISIVPVLMDITANDCLTRLAAVFDTDRQNSFLNNVVNI